MNWMKLWLDIFGTTSFLGIDMGFWVSLTLVLLIVIFMNIIFWTMKPRNRAIKKEKNK